MTIQSLWTQVVPLAAVARRWNWSGDFHAGPELWHMPYAQQAHTDLNETFLPFMKHGFYYRTQLPLLLEFSTYGASDSGSGVEVDGRNFYIFDIYERLRDPYLREAFTVANGRDLPCDRMRAYMNQVGFAPSLGVDYSEWTGSVDGTARAILARHVPSMVMFVPRTNGTTTWGGVYACMRPIINRALTPEDGAVIDYTNMVLPSAFVFEIGELVNGDHVARDSLVVPSMFGYADMGVGRSNLADATGTKFVCGLSGGSIAVLGFPFVPQEDSTLCGTLLPDSGLVWGVEQVIAYPAGFTRAPFFGIGECRAFKTRQPDHGKLVRLAFFAGAAATPPYHDVGDSREQKYLVRSPEWEGWAYSMFPHTPHPSTILTAEGARLLEDIAEVDALRRKKTPIYEIRHYTTPVESTELYPSREVQASVACLENYAASNLMSPYTSLADCLPEKTPNHDMVICGKRVKSVTVTLEPWAAADIADVVVGTSAIDPSAGKPNIEYGRTIRSEPSSAGWVPHEYAASILYRPWGYWVPAEPIPIPAGFLDIDAPSNPNPAPIYTGTAAHIRVDEIDETETATLTKGAISATDEATAVLLEHRLMGRIKGIGGPTTPQTIGGLHQGFNNYDLELTPDSRDGSVILKVAPLTGTYTCERFSVGETVAAGNWFRFSGSGQWQHSGSIDYSAYLRVVTKNGNWVYHSPGYQRRNIPPRSVSWHGVLISEQWSLATDHIELYSALSVRLQAAGTFDPNYTAGFGDARDAVYAGQILPDAPRGQLLDIVAFTEGNEPRPAIGIQLHARSVMRGTLSVDADTSAIPNGYPWSLSGASSTKVASEAGGIDGRFDGDEWVSLDFGTSPFSGYFHQFNADQTEQLLNGEQVTATRWASADEDVDDPSEPAVWQFGESVRQYKVSVQLEFEPD